MRNLEQKWVKATWCKHVIYWAEFHIDLIGRMVSMDRWKRKQKLKNFNWSIIQVRLIPVVQIFALIIFSWLLNRVTRILSHRHLQFNTVTMLAHAHLLTNSNMEHGLYGFRKGDPLHRTNHFCSIFLKLTSFHIWYFWWKICIGAFWGSLRNSSGTFLLKSDCWQDSDIILILHIYPEKDLDNNYSIIKIEFD